MKRIKKSIATILIGVILVSNSNLPYMYAESGNKNNTELLTQNEEVKTNIPTTYSRSNITRNETKILGIKYSYSVETYTDSTSRNTYNKYTLVVGNEVISKVAQSNSANYSLANSKFDAFKRQLDNNIILKENGIINTIKEELEGIEELTREDIQDIIDDVNDLLSKEGTTVDKISKFITNKLEDKIGNTVVNTAGGNLLNTGKLAWSIAKTVIATVMDIVSPINGYNMKNRFDDFKKIDLDGPVMPGAYISSQKGRTVVLKGMAKGSNGIEVFANGKKIGSATTNSKGEYTVKLENIDNSKTNVVLSVASIDQYKNRSSYYKVSVIKNASPTITASDKKTLVNKSIDLLSDVKANDLEDGNLTKKVKIESKNVNFKKAGTYSVKYSVTDSGGVKTEKTINVIVEPPKSIAVTGVTLNKSSITLLKGNKSKLSFTIKPSNATNTAVTWSSSNTKVAKVDTNGNVTAIGKGTATITVKTKDGYKTATCKVTVNDPIKVKSISLNTQSITIIKGRTAKLTATLNPKNATNKDVIWSSSNTKAAKVDQNGNVTAISSSAGLATITVKTKDGSKTAKCIVSVNNGVYKQNKIKFTVNVPKSFKEKYYIEMIDTKTNKVLYTSTTKTGSSSFYATFTLDFRDTSFSRKIRIRRSKDKKAFDTSIFKIDRNTINKNVTATYKAGSSGSKTTTLKNGTIKQN